MNKKLNRVLLSGLSLSLLLTLSGCVSVDSSGNPTGTVWNILGEPMAKLIQYFANNMGLGFGLAIILVTVIVRLIILPLGLYQSWKASYQSEKMAFLKPVFEPINEPGRFCCRHALFHPFYLLPGILTREFPCCIYIIERLHLIFKYFCKLFS